ncbi:Uncharacterised protein [Bordetella pertussis]|nr:Uncharacterised protein [Bordetella pertussis]
MPPVCANRCSSCREMAFRSRATCRSMRVAWAIDASRLRSRACRCSCVARSAEPS